VTNYSAKRAAGPRADRVATSRRSAAYLAAKTAGPTLADPAGENGGALSRRRQFPAPKKMAAFCRKPLRRGERRQQTRRAGMFIAASVARVV
jgi:hypothetical protein